MRYPVNYIAITQGLHYGKCIDFGWSNAYGGKNQSVFACDDGVVYRIENQKNGGNVIYIEHLNGMVSCYAHLADDSIIVKVGDIVLFAKYSGTDVKIDDVEYKIISVKDALAVLA